MDGPTNDFSAGTTDPVTGLVPSTMAGLLSEWTTLNRSSAGLRAILNNGLGHDVTARLTLDMSPAVDMKLMTGYSVYMDVTAATISSVALTLGQIVFYSSATGREGSALIYQWGGASIDLGHNVKRANVWNGATLASPANGNSKQRCWLYRSATEQQCTANEIGGNLNVGCADIVIDQMLGTAGDAGPPQMLIEFSVPNGGNLDMLVHEIGIVGRMAA